MPIRSVSLGLLSASRSRCPCSLATMWHSTIPRLLGQVKNIRHLVTCTGRQSGQVTNVGTPGYYIALLNLRLGSLRSPCQLGDMVVSLRPGYTPCLYTRLLHNPVSNSQQAIKKVTRLPVNLCHFINKARIRKAVVNKSPEHRVPIHQVPRS